MSRAEPNIKSSKFTYLILFQTKVKLKFIIKLNYIFKLNSFYCRTSLNLSMSYLINLFIFIYSKYYNKKNLVLHTSIEIINS